jgi:serine/threonine-protein kinase
VSPDGDTQAAGGESLPKACPQCLARYPVEALFCPFDGAALAASPAVIAAVAATDRYIGCEIVGPIEIRELVGIGAMGRVYRGFQKGIDRDVAVKILHRELSASPTVVTRFHREAKVASRLAHPHVVHVLLTGQLPDGAMYIVMEYLDGLSLRAALAASGGAMPLTRALHIALAICDAAGEAHAQGIVHRDLKPENVMLVKRADDPDYVKVLDFGIARLNWGDSSAGTAAGLIFGTARYMSPEGAQGDAVGPPGDVYAIATMFYQMLAGRTPFDASQAVGLLVHQIHDPAPPLKSIALASDVPDPIAAAVMKNLAKKPDERADNARAFGRMLLEAAVTSGLSARDILAHPGMTGVAHPGRATAPPSTDRAPSRTEIAEPAPMADVDATMDEVRQPPGASPVPASGHQSMSPASTARGRDSGLGAGVASEPGTQTYRPSDPASSAGTRPGDRTAREPRDRGQVLPIVIVCFVFATLGAFAIASRTGWIGAHLVPPPSLDAVVSRANDALLQQRWDAPRGDNVRDITDDGLSRWPNEPQLLRIRTLACNDIVKVARAKRDDGNVGEALRLAKLAYRLDPSDDLAQRLAAEMEQQAQAPPADSVPPLASTVPAGTATAPWAVARATLDASSLKPGVGQAIDFSARVIGSAGGGRPKVDAPSFRVSGPGIDPTTQLPVVDDGSGVLRTTFAFLQGGRFEVTFAARADGMPVRAARSLQVEAAGRPSAPPPAPSAGEAPAPASSAKWL